jgi:hypothetical protein
MCCNNNPPKVKELLESSKKQIIAYKVYKLHSAPSYMQKCLISEYRYFVVNKPGIVQSNSRGQKPCMRYKEINKGIRVFLYKKDIGISKYEGSNYIIIPVICEMKDLLGTDDWNTAVFKKVTISKNAWKNATRKNIIK